MHPPRSVPRSLRRTDRRTEVDVRVSVRQALLIHPNVRPPVITSNVGGEYDGEKFSLRAYCWCEGDGMRTLDGGYIHHADGCPPNFEHHRSGLRVEWYKHAGRGAYMNKRLTPDELLGVALDCLSEIAITDIDLLRLRLGDED